MPHTLPDPPRQSHPASNRPPEGCDVLVVGGGINGVGIARDLAGRGYSVLLCEKDDLAAHTSSASTKLIHGGLRYLEYYEFGLVHKALAEREVLLKSAPHIIRPLDFIMPHHPAMRPAWLIRLGLFLYDNLAQRELLPASHGIDLRQHPAGKPLRPEFEHGFAYADGWVDDARLVVLNAVDAAARGARILTQTACSDLLRSADGWRATLTDRHGSTHAVAAKLVVNATGPWADRFLRDQVQQRETRHLRLVKGSHIVVPKLFDHGMAYIFQNPDQRIIFAIPYEADFTLIGTTEVDYSADIDRVGIDADEIAYLCQKASRYFRRAIAPDEVVWTYSGVRPLIDDESGTAAAVTRDYRLQLDQEGPPLLTVWGGKITTYRRLAEEAAAMIGSTLGMRGEAWTAAARLAGGDLTDFIGLSQRPDIDFANFLSAIGERYPWLPSPLRQRWARAYGSRLTQLLGDAHSLDQLGECVAPGLYAAELRYLAQAEWATCSDDVLWRRSKLGLHLSATQRDRVDTWCKANFPP